MCVSEAREQVPAAHAVNTLVAKHDGGWVPGWKIVRRRWDASRAEFKLLSQLADTEWTVGINVAQPLREVSNFSGGPLPGNNYGMHVLMHKPVIANLCRPLAHIKTYDDGEVILKVFVNPDKVMVVGIDSGSAGGMVETWVTHEVEVKEQDWKDAIAGGGLFDKQEPSQLVKDAVATAKNLPSVQDVIALITKMKINSMDAFCGVCKEKFALSRSTARDLYRQSLAALKATAVGVIKTSRPATQPQIAKQFEAKPAKMDEYRVRSILKSTPMSMAQFVSFVKKEVGMSREPARELYRKASK